MVIYKYPLSLDQPTKVQVPENYLILKIDAQGSIPTVWILVDESKCYEKELTIMHLPTGKQVEEAYLEDKEYIDTVQISYYVAHFFMREEVIEDD